MKLALLIILLLLPSLDLSQVVSDVPNQQKLEFIDLAATLISIGLLIAPKGVKSGFGAKKEQAAGRDTFKATNEKAKSKLRHKKKKVFLKRRVVEKGKTKFIAYLNNETRKMNYQQDSLDRFVKISTQLVLVLMCVYICFYIIYYKVYMHPWTWKHSIYFSAFIALFGILRWMEIIRSKKEVEATIEQLIWQIIKLIRIVRDIFFKKNK